MHVGKTNGKTNAIFSQHTITIVSALSLFYVVLTVCVSLSPCPFTHTHTHTHTHTLCCRSFGWLKKKRESRESRFIVVVVACSLSTVDVDFRTYSLRYSVFTSALSSSSSLLPSSFLRSWRRLPSILLYHQRQFHHYHQLQQVFNHFKWFQIE